MLATHSERPRELKWYHAGPMLYGDWGTSRFYVLGLALFYALHASFWYVFMVGLLVAAVGWAYTIICRCYPDGGGVYSAAKHTNRQLAVVGALLLFADYIVTASISAYDGIRYMGVPKSYVPYIAMAAIVLVGVVNYIGPKKAGTIALVIALATLVLTFILTLFSVSHVALGWKAIHSPTGTLPMQWSNFVAVVLALSGVEAIANMTGIMVPPVTKTANKAIWPVLIEVVVLNIVLATAMNGLPAAGYDLGSVPGNAYTQVRGIMKDHPDWRTNAEAQADIKHEAELAGVTAEQVLEKSNELEIEATKDRLADWEKNPQSHALLMAIASERAKAAGPQGGSMTAEELIARSDEFKEHIEDTQDAVLRVMAKVYVDPHGFTLHVGSYNVGMFSLACGIVFGFLLLSAVNTAVADMVSIQYVMSRDTELPKVLTKLNIFGVPWYALIAAVGLPIGLLCIFQDVYTLANLYAVGVVGAIAINLGSCSINKEMPVKKWERGGLVILAVIMICIEATLVYQKPDARYFAAFVLFAGLAARFFTKTYPKLSFKGRGYSLAAWAGLLVVTAGCVFHFEDIVTSTLRDSVVIFQIPFAPKPHYATFAFASLLLMFGGSSAIYALRYLTGKMPVPAVPGATLKTGVMGSAMPSVATGEVDLSKSHVLVATRGGKKLLDFAANYCRKTDAVMFVLFVRQINVTPAGGTHAPGAEEDPEAVKAFSLAAEICRKSNVKMMSIYVISQDVAYSILDFAATYGVEAVLMGVSREGALLRALGDVITAVADNLPEDISLLIHA